MSEIKQLKRFIYSATVTSGSGSQSFYIDAKSREEADARAANNESDGMYADDSEVTDLDALEYEDETTVDDFGEFPLISREQSLIAQLEAAQKERDDLLNQEFQQRLANAEHQLYMKDLAIHNIKASRKAQFRKRLAAEAALSAANEKLNKSVVLPKGYSVRAGHPINEGERHVLIPKEGGRWLSRFDVEHAIRVAGFTVEGE
ncbi:hypothetical protein [Yersinia enterocolitica]|uniref:hypothetical protein n=1 Tax=Yersinia enterocolitica TaxID=630 RepID=UPI0005DCDBCF|nr:hypothetical protein [Yersinia enterocolitica]CFB71219.1 Uncharacterised protein [Yersinia enterocolitica]